MSINTCKKIDNEYINLLKEDYLANNGYKNFQKKIREEVPEMMEGIEKMSYSESLNKVVDRPINLLWGKNIGTILEDNECPIKSGSLGDFEPAFLEEEDNKGRNHVFFQAKFGKCYDWANFVEFSLGVSKSQAHFIAIASLGGKIYKDKEYGARKVGKYKYNEIMSLIEEDLDIAKSLRDKYYMRHGYKNNEMRKFQYEDMKYVCNMLYVVRDYMKYRKDCCFATLYDLKNNAMACAQEDMCAFVETRKDLKKRFKGFKDFRDKLRLTVRYKFFNMNKTKRSNLPSFNKMKEVPTWKEITILQVNEMDKEAVTNLAEKMYYMHINNEEIKILGRHHMDYNEISYKYHCKNLMETLDLKDVLVKPYKEDKVAAAKNEFISCIEKYLDENPSFVDSIMISACEELRYLSNYNTFIELHITNINAYKLRTRVEKKFDTKGLYEVINSSAPIKTANFICRQVMEKYLKKNSLFLQIKEEHNLNNIKLSYYDSKLIGNKIVSRDPAKARQDDKNFRLCVVFYREKNKKKGNRVHKFNVNSKAFSVCYYGQEVDESMSIEQQDKLIYEAVDMHKKLLAKK